MTKQEMLDYMAERDKVILRLTAEHKLMEEAFIKIKQLLEDRYVSRKKILAVISNTTLQQIDSKGD